MRNCAGKCKCICSYNLVYNFLIQLLPLQRSVFEVHFSNAFCHRNKAFPKGTQNEIVLLLVIFHQLYSKYKGAKIFFHSCRYQNQNFSFVSQSCRSCRTRVAFVSLLSGTCVVKQTRSNFSLELLLKLFKLKRTFMKQCLI